MNFNRTEITIPGDTEELIASVVYQSVLSSADDFEIEWVANNEGDRIENGEIVYKDEICEAFAEYLINKAK